MSIGDTARTGRRQGRDGWSPDRPATVSKRSLVAVSHAIEQALLAGPLTEPTVVVALFQNLAYFEREYAVYERLVAAGAVVVLAFADGETHDVPPGCRLVVLDPHEPLADEWSVVAVGPDAGAFLVATDGHRFDPTEHSLEAGREFTGRWGYSRVQAANELARMRAALGRRLDAGAGAIVDRLLAQVMPAGGAVATSVGSDGERWATHSLHRMVERMQDAREGSRILRAQLRDAHAAVTARAAAHVEPQSGLTSPEFLTRWTSTGGPTALPVGLALIDVPGLEGVEHRLGRRAAYHAARRVATAATEPLGPVDAAVRLSEREFAVVVPGASSRHIHGVVTAVVEQLRLSSDGYPNVDLTPVVASTVTLARPLPFDDLRRALGSPDQPSSTRADDPVVVVVGSAGDGPQDRDEPGPSTDRIPRIRVSGDPTTAPEDPADGEAGPASADLWSDSGASRPVPDPLEPDPLGTPDPLGNPEPWEVPEPSGTVAPSLGSNGRRPSPARRRSGGEPALSMLSGLPRRIRDDGTRSAVEDEPPPTAS